MIMDPLTYIEILAAGSAFAVSALLFAFPRFGSASGMLVLTLVPAALSSGIQGMGAILGWAPEDVIFPSFACLVLSAAAGCIASYTLERADFRSELEKNKWFFTIASLVAPALIVCLYLFRPPAARAEAGLIAMGPAGYASAAYLLLVSVVILANLEQTLRSAEEHVRWEIKFLLLGIASVFATTIYIASQILLYPPERSFLPLQALRVFPVILLCACFLILGSWRRSTGKGRVVVSQGVVYSTITLFSVGAYLVTSSLAARWFTAWLQPEVPLEPIFFLVSATALSAVLLGTAFRHRVRRWIRRNVFAGRYDYRLLWMDATERVRAIDSPAATATALAQLIHDALGAIDITVWLQARDAQVMNLAAARGSLLESISEETLRLADIPTGLTEPVAVSEVAGKSLQDFLTRLKASLLVPLISSGRLVGLLTVGADRSGKGLDREAREFLRVLAVHAAGEFHKAELLESLVQTREAEAFRTFSTFLLHDLKNFASTLSLIAKNASRHHGNPDFQLDAFRSVFETAEKMKRLCNGLRSFSTGLATNRTWENLNQVVDAVVRDFDAGLIERIKLELSPVPMIQIDRQEFSRVLQNLILNANEASPSGAIDLSISAETDGILISVTDKGKGIPKDFLEKELFQPFHTTKGDGLGIGLFQSKKIIEAHEGTIEVESREGEGTSVRIHMPLPKSETISIRPSGSGLETVDDRAEKSLRHAAAKS